MGNALLFDMCYGRAVAFPYAKNQYPAILADSLVCDWGSTGLCEQMGYTGYEEACSWTLRVEDVAMLWTVNFVLLYIAAIEISNCARWSRKILEHRRKARDNLAVW